MSNEAKRNVVTLNKNDLIEAVKDLTNTSKKDAGVALDAVIDAITGLLQSNPEADVNLQLVGFGTFKRTFKDEREGRNPANGETITIAASNKVSFTAGATLKNSVNK